MFSEEIAFSFAADDSSASFSEDGQASIGCTESEKVVQKVRNQGVLTLTPKKTPHTSHTLAMRD